jgi:hypothetical protein
VEESISLVFHREIYIPQHSTGLMNRMRKNNQQIWLNNHVRLFM